MHFTSALALILIQSEATFAGLKFYNLIENMETSALLQTADLCVLNERSGANMRRDFTGRDFGRMQREEMSADPDTVQWNNAEARGDGMIARNAEPDLVSTSSAPAPAAMTVGGTTVTVNSIAGLRAALADTSVGTIRVAPGTYNVTDRDLATGHGNASGFLVSHDVTIEVDGTLGQRADFYAGTDFMKGIFLVNEGVNVTFDGIGFFDTRVNGESFQHNEAAIRHEGADLTVLNSYFENCYNAILGNALSGSEGGNLVVENSTFVDNGDPGDYPGYFTRGQEHHIYFEGASVSVDGSSFTNSGYGHSIKVVVEDFANITNNYIDDGNAPANSAINSTGGGALTVTGNTIIKSEESENPYVIYYEALRRDGDDGAITISDNTITSYHDGTKILGNLSGATAVFNNNDVFSGSSADINPAHTLHGLASMSGNTLNGVSFDGNDFASRAVNGTAGADTILISDGGLNYDIVNARNGGDGNDLMLVDYRTEGPEALLGGAGDDVISGGPGSDMLYGGDGNDTIFSGELRGYNSGDNMFGGAGNDRIYYNPRSYNDSGQQGGYSDGGDGNDWIDARYSIGQVATGGRGDDVLIGSFNRDAGTDWLNGGSGSDILFGGAGRDTMMDGGPGNDVGTDIAVYQGAYGVDLTVGGNQNWQTIDAISSVGDVEVGYGEVVSNIEYVQFSNGVWNVATQTFSAGQVMVDINAILAEPIPVDPAQSLMPYDRTMVGTNVQWNDGNQLGTTGNDTARDSYWTSSHAMGQGNDVYVYQGWYGSAPWHPAIENANEGIDTVAVTINGTDNFTLFDNVEIGVSYQLIATDAKLYGNAGDNLLVDVDDLNPYFVESTEIVTLNGGDGNDILYGGNNNDTLIGGNGVDTVVMRGNRADYTIAAGNGSITDNVTAGTNDGTDSLSGIEKVRFADGTLDLATGVFTAQAFGSTSIAYAGGSFSLQSFQFSSSGQPPQQGQTLTGTAGVDTLTGGSYADTITGLGSDDILSGGGGNDVFRVTGAADGFDAVDGGSGSDTIIATAANAIIGLKSLTGVETISSGGFSGVSILGSSAANTLDFSAVTLSGITSINGGAGNDVITGTGAADIIIGGVGDDELIGGDGDDQFQVSGTGHGFDYFEGAGGNDSIIATANNTVIGIYWTSGIDTISSGGFSNVSVRYSDGHDVVNLAWVGITGITKIDFGAGNDYVTGSVGNDVFVGGAGNDDIDGNDGNDTFQVSGTGSGFDIFRGGNGTDTVIATSANTVIGLLGGSSIETYSSGGFANVSILTTDSNETYNFNGVTLTGITLINLAGGNDTVTGSAAADAIRGGSGQDTMTGLAGADRFVFDDGDFAGMAAGTADRIIDFTKGSDKLDLSLVDANLANGTSTDQAFSFIGTSAFSGVAGQLRYQQTSGNTYVMGDQNGDGVADFWVRLDGLKTMAASDFIL